MCLDIDGDSGMLNRFSALADDALKSGSRDGFFAVEREFVELVLQTPFVVEALNADLSKIARMSAYEPEGFAAGGITLARSEYWQITYGAPESNTHFLYSYPRHATVLVVGDEPLIVRRYSASATIDTDVFDPDVTIHLRAEEEYRRESLFTLDARCDVDEFVDSSGVRVVTLSGPLRGAIRWAFCRKTFRAVQPVATDPADAAIVTYIRALATMNCTDAVPTLSTLTDHGSHFVRWTALQALIRLNPDSASSGLRRALKDSHPHIQQASEKAIALLSA